MAQTDRDRQWDRFGEELSGRKVEQKVYEMKVAMSAMRG